jgi:hypothetical protein
MKEITTGSGNFKPTPLLNFRAGVNTKFKGKLLAEGRSVKVKKGTKIVYEFAAIDGDMPTQIKDAAGNYVDTEVKEGDKVAVFAPTVLNTKLAQVPVGTVVEIEYQGLQIGKTGTQFHAFKVSVEE